MSYFVIKLVALLTILSKFECLEIFCPRTDTFGPSKNVTCVLPFIFQDNVYSQCTNASFKAGGKFWCPTRVGGDGAHIVDKDEWGYCHKNCSEIQGKKIFSFDNQFEKIRLGIVGHKQMSSELTPTVLILKEIGGIEHLNKSKLP